MKSKFWFFLCIIQTVILLTIIIVSLLIKFSTIKVNEVNLQEYVEENEKYGWSPEIIPDAKTAKIIGMRIIDNLADKQGFYITTIEYDKENRLWFVEKGYLFGGGGVVIMEQDSGKVVTVHLIK